MPRLRDFNNALQNVGPAELGKRVYAEVNKDNVFTNAAAMAYAWVFALFPLIIFLMALVPYLPEQLRNATPGYIDKVMYGAGLQYAIVGPVKDTLTPLLTNTHKGLLSFGLVLTLYAASGGMNTTMSALDAVLYYVGPSRRKGLRLFTPGATFTVLGWIITGWGLRIYFAHFDSYSKTYGAVAGMVIMLLVFYLDATIILIGA